MSLRPLAALLIITLSAQLSACGTLFYPERRGQISGQIDPAIAAMNAIGVLFFVIPGLIAFAVDFSTGAIYMPGSRYSLAPERLQPALQADGQVGPRRAGPRVHAQAGNGVPPGRHGLPVEELQAVADL